MPSTQHFAWQLLLYGAMTLTYVCVGLSLLGARTTLRRWLAGSYLVVFNEYVVAFMMALCGYDPHEWLLGHPQTTQFFGLALTSMWVTLAAVLVFSRNSRLPRLLDGLPPLRIPESQLRTLSLLVSFTCAVLSIVMSAGGYHGYYLAEEYISNPPLWRDVAGLLVTIGSMLSFVLVLFCYTRHGRILGAEWMLLLVWTGAGLASGFKMQVVFPFFCVLVAAWLANRLGSRHWAFFALAFTLAYGVIEPMRAWRWSADHDNGVKGLYDLTTTEGVTLPEVGEAALAFLARVDFTATAVLTLEADQFGQVNGYRERLQATYRYLPALTFVPRLLWPGKPLGDHSRDLAAELYGAANSLTPSTAVDSYLWGGYVGVVINSILTVYFLVLAGLLLTQDMHQPLRYLPALLLVPVLAMPVQIKAFHYIMVLRAFVGTALFYAIARRLGIVQGRVISMPRLRPVPQAPAASLPSR